MHRPTSGDVIDLSSDTVTRPSHAMLDAMMSAETGDEQRDGDPSVTRLCSMVAERLGKEAAMFLPSGTMANQVAMLLHCRPGDEIIAAADSHITYSEGGGAAALAGAQLLLVDHRQGEIDAARIRAALRPHRPQSVRSRLLLIEQTFNRGGGAVWSLDALEAATDVAREAGLAIHLDGARLFNAEVASGVEAATYAKLVDTVWIDLTKGLGCPFGAVFAGSKAAIEEAWRYKIRLGGGMRQAGIMAAAGVYALKHNVARLAEDHARAKRLADMITGTTDLTIASPRIDTNIVHVDLRPVGITAGAFTDHLAEAGVCCSQVDTHTLRLVTHLDCDDRDIDIAAARIREAEAELCGSSRRPMKAEVAQP